MAGDGGGGFLYGMNLQWGWFWVLMGWRIWILLEQIWLGFGMGSKIVLWLILGVIVADLMREKERGRSEEGRVTERDKKKREKQMKANIV